MKRVAVLFISTLTVIFLASCTNNPVEQNENNMVLKMENNADFDFYSVEVSTNKTRGGISNADGSKIQKGETLRKEYIDQKDFDLEGETIFEFALTGEEGQRIPLKEITLELATNKEYFFEITGNSANEANIKMVE